MRVRCIKANTDKFTENKIYEVSELGILVDNKNCKHYIHSSIEQTNKYFASQFEEVKEMTKEDLKVGYVVVHNNGDVGMVMPMGKGLLVIVDKDGRFINVHDLNNDLTDEGSNDLNTDYDDDYGIREVYGLSEYPSEVCNISTENRKLLWQREKPIKEVAMSELEKMFGCEVKIINDK